jgi:hypothetical protein
MSQPGAGRQYSGKRSQLIALIGVTHLIPSSTVIDNILNSCNEDPASAIAYFYFDFQNRDKQQTHDLLRSLIAQLSNRRTQIPVALEQLYSSCQSTHRLPDLDDLMTTLEYILQEFRHTYIIIDALDESTEREVLLKMIQTMADWKIGSLHLLVTS